MRFRASGLHVFWWDISSDDFFVAGEVLADLDNVTIEFDEATGALVAENGGDRIEATAEKARIRVSEILVIARGLLLDGRPTSWFLFGVSSEDANGFARAHYRWAQS